MRPFIGREVLDRRCGSARTAELIAERWDLSREERDEVAVRSHRLAAYAIEAGSVILCCGGGLGAGTQLQRVG